MTLEPIIPLASSMEASPGTYALLVGSGISRAAGVPTGWEVVTDLARRVAGMAGEEPGDDPVAWYARYSGTDVDYSRLLEQLAPTQAERRALLEQYFEPTDEERDRGLKQPTQGHRAIARLAAHGHIKVVVTTNFDRLLETALTQEGVQPQVITSADGIRGAAPLNHVRLTVVKVHGDYMSPDLRNTVDELAGYPAELDALLDEIFDRYGLVVCGWSGEWDVALRQAIDRAPNRRYATYWCRRSLLAGEASQLVANRGAVEVPIVDADRFFDELATKVAVIAELKASPAPTTTLAVAELKRYLPDPVQRIRLADLMSTECARAAEAVGPERFPAPSDRVTREKLMLRLASYEAQMERPVVLLMAGVYFGEPAVHDELWVRAVLSVEQRPRNLSGNVVWLGLQGYPTVIAVYAVGIASIASNRLSAFLKVLRTRIKSRYGTGEESILYKVAPANGIGSESLDLLGQLDGGRRKHTPLSDHLHQLLQKPARWMFTGDETYDEAFDQLEYVMSAISPALGGHLFFGRFWWRHFRFPPHTPPTIEPYRGQLVTPGLLDSNEAFDQAVDSLNEFARRIPPPF